MYFETDANDYCSTKFNESNECINIDDGTFSYSYVLLPNGQYSFVDTKASVTNEMNFDAFINNDRFVEGEISKNVTVNEMTYVKEKMNALNESNVKKEITDESSNEKMNEHTKASKNENVNNENEVKKLKRKLNECYEMIDKKSDNVKDLKDEISRKNNEIRKWKNEIY
jgi:hypothetical protein